MTKTLYIHLIHTESLVQRKKYINGTIDRLKTVSESCDYEFKINIITEPSVDYIDKNIAQFNSRVNYDKDSSDDDFNNLIQKLNAPQISNIEKHRIAYENILNIYNMSKNKDDLHLILEDDVVISQEYSKNIDILFNNFSKIGKWDILFTCLSHLNVDNNSIDLYDSRDNFKILLSKSSYFINPDVALKLNKYLNTFKYSLKIALSKFIYDNKDVKSFTLNKHIFLEGSKLGLLLSSTNNNNVLYQNNDFIMLARITSNEKISEEQLKEALQIYKRLTNLNSADILHTMGILYYKVGDYVNAKQYLVDAVLNMKKNNGYLTNSSEILNNCINMHQYNQVDLEDCIKRKSKYNI